MKRLKYDKSQQQLRILEKQQQTDHSDELVEQIITNNKKRYRQYGI